MFSTFKMIFCYLTLGGMAGLFGIPYSLAVGNVRFLYRWVMWIVRTGVRAAGIEVVVTGRENVPPNVSCIFLSNHVSNLDPPVILPEIPPMTSVLLKKELMRIPVLGTAMRMGKFVPVERGNNRDAARRSVADAADALRSGLHMLIFPEGTRSKDGRLAAFKRGPFYLAEDTGAPIIPMAISGTQTLMRKGSAAITPGVVRLQMLPAVWPKDYPTREELMAAVRSAIALALPDDMKPVAADKR